MNNYSFSTLNDKEFELLVRDLLNSALNLSLQSFKTGKDKGIDLRISTSNNNNNIVVQVKHYAGSNFNNLKHTLKSEIQKVQKLNPERYIVVTSLNLSAEQKDQIKSLFTPYLLNSNDVISNEDLNRFLAVNKEIEKRYFKLWFSSVNILQTIFNNAIEGRTNSLLETIANKIKYYVITNKFDSARKILSIEKLLLITGQPGIGKTTLAEILIFDFAKLGYKIYKVENIKEAEDVMSMNEEEKQLFYFDDFLGANYFEIVNSQKSENQITSFIDRIRTSPNKYLILTTRTIILNHAIEKYEKIGHSKIASEKFEIKLHDYTLYEKALILYNHLYFRGINSNLLQKIVEERFYLKIVKHKNFTPRIIEFITDSKKINHIEQNDYQNFIIQNLKNPKEIWRFSFNQQINYFDRCFLFTLFTFHGIAEENQLFEAFEERMKNERIFNNQTIKNDQFNESIRILLDGFISSTFDVVKKTRTYSFINPSLTDFLLSYLNDSYSDRKSVIQSVIFSNQLFHFEPTKKIIPLEKPLQEILKEKLLNNQIKDKIYQSIDNTNFNYIENIYFLFNYCYEIDNDINILENLSKIDLSKNLFLIHKEILNIFFAIDKFTKCHEFIKENFNEYVKIIDYISDYDYALKIPKLFSLYNKSLQEFYSTVSGKNILHDIIQQVLDNEYYDIKNSRLDEIFEMNQVEIIHDDIYNKIEELKTILLHKNCSNHNFVIDIDTEFWLELIEENKLRESKSEYFFDDDYYFESRVSDEGAINDLFS